jgi:hypothetical protein
VRILKLIVERKSRQIILLLVVDETTLTLTFCFQKEEERLRASVRRESKQKRIRERTATGRGMSGGYLEPDREGYEDSEDEGGISLTAIKNKYKRGGSRGNRYLIYINISY